MSPKIVAVMAKNLGHASHFGRTSLGIPDAVSVVFHSLLPTLHRIKQTTVRLIFVPDVQHEPPNTPHH